MDSVAWDVFEPVPKLQNPLPTGPTVHPSVPRKWVPAAVARCHPAWDTWDSMDSRLSCRWLVGSNLLSKSIKHICRYLLSILVSWSKSIDIFSRFPGVLIRRGAKNNWSFSGLPWRRRDPSMPFFKLPTWLSSVHITPIKGWKLEMKSVLNHQSGFEFLFAHVPILFNWPVLQECREDHGRTSRAWR